MNIGQRCLYRKMLYKLTRSPIFTIPILKKFINRYNIYIKSNWSKISLY